MQPLRTLFSFIIFLIFFLFISLSIYSYHPQDPGLNIVGSTEVKNLCGVIGAYIASILYFFFGFVSLLLPLLFLLILLYFLGISLRKILISQLSLILALSLSSSLLFDLVNIKNFYLWNRYPLNGGFLGEISYLISKITGIPGLLFLIFLLYFVPLIITFDKTKLNEGFKNLRKINLRKIFFFDGERGA